MLKERKVYSPVRWAGLLVGDWRKKQCMDEKSQQVVFAPNCLSEEVRAQKKRYN